MADEYAVQKAVDSLDRQIKATQASLQELQQRIGQLDANQQPLVAAAFDELSSTINELLCTQEDLQHAHAHLQAEIAAREQMEQALQASEEKYRRLVEGSPNILYIYSDKRGAIYWSQRVQDVLGYSPDDLIEDPFLWYNVIHPDDIPMVDTVIQRGQAFDIEYRIQDAEGNWHWLHDRSISKRQIADESIIEGLVTDITERKRVEQEIQESKALLDATGRMARVGGWELDTETLAVRWTEETYHIHEVPLDYKPPLQEAINFFHPAERERLSQAIQKALDDGEPYDMQLRFITAQGNRLWARTMCRPQIVDGKVVKLMGTFQDITARKEAEDKLRASEQELKWLLKSMINAFVIFDSVFDDAGNFISYRFVYINDAYEKITGVENDAVRGKTVHEVWPETENTWIERYGRVAVTGIPESFDMYHDPTKKWYHCNVYRPWNTSNRFCVVFEDITERKRMHEALQESEERFRITVHSSPIGVGLVDSTGQLVDCNAALANIVGYSREELLRLNFAEFTHPTDLEREWQLINALWDGEATEYRMEKRYIHKDGHTVWVDLAASLFKGEQGELAFGFAFVQDITERKQAEDELRRASERLQTLHEIDRAILAAESLEDIAQATLQRIKLLLPYPTCSVLTYNADAQNFYVLGTTVQGEPATISPGARLPSQPDIIAKLALGETVLLENIQLPHISLEGRHLAAISGVQAVLLVPLVIRQELIGILAATAEDFDTFTQEHAEILGQVADSLAVALQQARLLEQTRADAETKALLLSEVNHRVKNNLDAIIGLLYLERRHAPPEALPAYQSIMESLTHHIIGLAQVHNLLSAARWQSLRLSKLAEQVVHGALKNFSHPANISADIAPSPVRVLPDQAHNLALILSELTINTLKYAIAGRETTHIAVYIKEGNGTITLGYRDDGPGYPDDVLSLERRSAGLEIIQQLVSKSLQGALNLYNNNGAVTEIQFKNKIQEYGD